MTETAKIAKEPKSWAHYVFEKNHKAKANGEKPPVILNLVAASLKLQSVSSFTANMNLNVGIAIYYERISLDAANLQEILTKKFIENENIRAAKKGIKKFVPDNIKRIGKLVAYMCFSNMDGFKAEIDKYVKMGVKNGRVEEIIKHIDRFCSESQAKNIVHQDYMAAFRHTFGIKRAAEIIDKALDPQTLISLNYSHPFAEGFIERNAMIAEDVRSAISNSDLHGLVRKLKEYVSAKILPPVARETKSSEGDVNERTTVPTPEFFVQIRSVVKSIGRLTGDTRSKRHKEDVAQIFDELRSVCGIPKEEGKERAIVVVTEPPKELLDLSKEVTHSYVPPREAEAPEKQLPVEEKKAEEKPAEEKPAPQAPLDMEALIKSISEEFEADREQREASNDSAMPPEGPTTQGAQKMSTIDPAGTGEEPIKTATKGGGEPAVSRESILEAAQGAALSAGEVQGVVHAMKLYIGADKAREEEVIGALIEKGAYDVVAAYDQSLKDNNRHNNA